MDVHRSRFVRYPTSAISALAFTRSNDSGYTGTALPTLRLAIGRANGNIEIWNPQKGLWVQETVFAGSGVSIDGLVWTQDPDDADADGNAIVGQYRLFSIASSTSVTEWDLGSGRPKRQSTGNFSELWCMSAQRRWSPQKASKEEPRAQDIVAGCGDGTIVLLSTADDDLQFKRFLSRASGSKARCICVTYQTPNRVVAGFVDNMIRIYDTRNGSIVRTMSLGVGGPGRPRNTLVWQVRCSPNGDIVSADSAGEVKFWDGKTYSLLQRLESHESDCLDLAVSSDGRTVFAGGIDGKVAVHQLSTNPQGRKSWSKTSHRRIHNGEVKAMATYDSKGMSVVVSGGADVAPMVTPMREFGKENVRSLPSLPQSPPVVSAPKARLLVSWWDTSIYIWKIARSPRMDLPEDAHQPRKLVAHISLDTDTNIRKVSITADGRLLAASTDKEVKVFQLRKRYGHDPLAIRKVPLPDHLANHGSRLITFSPNGNWLALVSHAKEVFVARITEDPSRPKFLQILPKLADLDRRYQQSRFQTAFRDYDRTINHLAFANDSTVLVASDLSGYLDSWVLEGPEDLSAAMISTRQPPNGVAAGSDFDSDSSEDDDDIAVFYGQHWTDNPSGHLLPKLKSAPLVLTFRPTRPLAENGVEDDAARQSKRREQHRVWVLTAKHEMLEFDILGGRLSDWSRRNPTAALPEDFKKILGRVMGAVWDVSEERERIWLYGDSFVFMLNVGPDLSDGVIPLPQKKRRTSKTVIENEDDAPKRRKLYSGAGGEKTDSHRSGAANVVNQYEDGAWTKVDLDRQDEHMLNDDEEGDEADFRLSRIESNGDDATAPDTAHESNSTECRKFWCTFKYRPILGMVALEDVMDLDDEKPVEVVIVERPHWDVQKESRSR